MKCPFDDSPLQVVNRSGVEIDWCPTCKGVWLERGELDKLIEQVSNVPEAPPTRPVEAATARPAAPPPRDQPRRPDGDWDDDFDDGWSEPRREDRRDDDSYGKRRRGSFLSEIFDF